MKAVSAATAVSNPARVSAPRDAALLPVGVVLVSELVVVAAEVVVLYNDLGKAENIEIDVQMLTELTPTQKTS